MFRIYDDMTIHITRGDIGVIDVRANKNENELYTFQPYDIVRLRVFTKKRHEDVVLSKDVTIESETQLVTIQLDREDTKIGELINKPVEYWYEVELNPDRFPQTFIGYDENGPKRFMLYPEGGEIV